MLFFVKIGGYFKNSPAIYRLPNTKIIKYGFSKLALNAINSITKSLLKWLLELSRLRGDIRTGHLVEVKG